MSLNGRPERGSDLASLESWASGGGGRARVEIHLSGTVQGVGFRPFVFTAAERHRLAGHVRNGPGGLSVVVEGAAGALRGFVGELRRPPPAARIEGVEWEAGAEAGLREFHIEESDRKGERGALAPPDLAPCDECLRELRDPSDRRFRYPFLNCTRCGPRFTIIDRLPYDRERTVMRGFPLCEPCFAEFRSPRDRRFHAQPVACPDCGPHLSATPAPSGPLAHDPLRAAAEALSRGGIVALKSVGGFHLACDARNEGAVARLRDRKRRPDKPFAVFVPSLAAARRLARLSPAEERLLSSPERPVVLVLPKEGHGLAPSVTRGSPWVGLLLPSSPLQELLGDAAGGAPLVMTSGNRGDEPIATAAGELGDLADLVLDHDRAVLSGCDDSVARVHGGKPVLLRRARGYTPAPVRCPVSAPVAILAAGASLKSTFTLAHGRLFHISQHLGDLDGWPAFRRYTAEVGRFERLLSLSPRALAVDLHPDYASSSWARERAEREGIPCVGVQHHHAHFASCLAENADTGPAIGVIFDGTGYGEDGTLWGGEFLVGGLARSVRAGRLRPLALPGGVAAIREPWRTAAAWLLDAGLEPAALLGTAWEERAALACRLARISLPASSAGRLFDAFSCLVTGRDRVTFEGQAATELEGIAAGCSGAYPLPVTGEALLEVDTRELARSWAEDRRKGEAPCRMAYRFHAGLADAILAVCRRLRARTGIARVALSGGVFANGLLRALAEERLTSSGFGVYCHSLVPPNDGGISFGQAAALAARLQE